MMDDSNQETGNDGQSPGRFKQFLKKLGFNRGQDSTLRESIEEVIEEHHAVHEEEPFGDEEKSMLRNLLSSGELRIDDIMVPRADILAVEINTSFRDLIAMFSDAAHSRLPVYRGNLDNVAGFIHVKDVVIRLAGDDKELPAISDLVRPVLFVAPSMKAMDLLAKMRVRRLHMAIVVDEYGGTDGLVTIEDLVEQIVGDIEDEHDEDERPSLTQTAHGKALDADARVALEELEEMIHADFLPDERDEDVDTIGGLVVSLAGRVPEIGETIEHETGYRFEVLDADARRLKKIRVHLPKELEIHGRHSH